MKKKKLKNFLNVIKSNLIEYQQLSDDDLKKQTTLFKQRIHSGETLEDLLPEAYAVMIEANKRILGLELYDVQILGAIVLFYGNVAEMKTGEGKTLTATLPMYLRGLQGTGNFLITTNEYLAWRDAEEVGKVYRWLGLSVAVGVKSMSLIKRLIKKWCILQILYTPRTVL
ncbi:hypothetical protein [Lactococcus lactis]|uniref:hypothetical protein n=1 Tax=Lactococcus lactis TaxID=1358 RepID=UPI00288044D7|nr:hypothetical protein [Lactococcus lactis]